jgi:hypothetical protein
VPPACGMAASEKVPDLQLGAIAITFYDPKKLNLGADQNFPEIVCPWCS